MSETSAPEVEYTFAVISPLLQDPASLTIGRTEDEKGVLLTVKIAKADMGRLIGKQGANIKAVRTVVQSFGAKSKLHVSIKVPEPEYGTDTDTSR